MVGDGPSTRPALQHPHDHEHDAAHLHGGDDVSSVDDGRFDFDDADEISWLDRQTPSWCPRPDLTKAIRQ